MRLSVLALGALLAAPLTMKADTAYIYTGTPFTTSYIGTNPQNPPGTIVAPYTSGDKITGEFTVSSPLAGNLNDAFITPESYSFTDGYQTITNTNDNGGPFFLISTDGSGDITSYAINVTAASDPNDFFIIQTVPPGSSPADDAKVDYNGETVSVITNTDGSFSGPQAVATTPEPTSFALMGSGLAGLMFEMRRRMGRA